MAVIMESTVRPPLFSRTFEAVPELVLSLEDTRLLADGVVVSYYWGRGGDPDAVVEGLGDDPEVAAVEPVTDVDDQWLYRVRLPQDQRGAALYGVVLDNDVTGLELRMTADGTAVRARYPDRDVLADIRAALETHDLKLTVHRVYEEAAADRADYGLTRKQREALLAAWHAGYYDVPREADLEEISATLGISHQSLAQRLRRGIHGLLAGTLVGPAGGGTEERLGDRVDGDR